LNQRGLLTQVLRGPTDQPISTHYFGASVARLSFPVTIGGKRTLSKPLTGVNRLFF
jgi:hypothetical protein